MAHMTSRLDRLQCYRYAVQDPETHAEVLRRMHAHGQTTCEATVLREDFAGTAADSVAWIQARPNRLAIAVDNDAQTTEWARKRAESILLERVGHL